jgi:adenylosuccinate lyase
VQLEPLTAISPIDGRYRSKVENLVPYFSEYGLIKCRIFVEIEYFIALCDLPLPPLKNIHKNVYAALRKIYKEFSLDDATQVKDIEAETNHDVKAVEYFIKTKFEALGLGDLKEFIHFGLTSQDINNTAIPRLIHNALSKAYAPVLQQTIAKLEQLVKDWKNIPMLAHTHGQPASPTKLGKEINVFVERLQVQSEQLRTIPCYAKFGGATGNFNAHHAAYPAYDWQDFANRFVSQYLQLQRSQVTTQIAHYDNYAAIFDALKRINTILLDLNQDIWQYISMNYFKQKIKKGEVGSSAMPHKVNPIDFENAEGNLGIANALFEHLSAKLPVSRLQRDLTDSTVLRNIGVAFAHSIIALASTLHGLDKLMVCTERIEADLENNWAVVAEAIQTILRRENYPNPYETLLNLTRTNENVNRKTIHEFIDSLNVDEKIKQELKRITPHNYTGIF